MSGKNIDNSVVRLELDNSDFEKDLKKSTKALDDFKKDITLSDEANASEKSLSKVSKGVKDLKKDLNSVDTTPLQKSFEKAAGGISQTLKEIENVVINQFFRNLTTKAMDVASTISTGIFTAPVTTGFQEYETQMGAVQTILANTQSAGTTITDVMNALNELNEYADLTIYNFTEMTRNIGTFTAAGVDLQTSVMAIKGIANLAAISGSTSEQASNAMYQLSQALAAGKVSLQDWNSVVNAGMGGKIFQDALVETAEKMGVVVDLSKGFRESISGQTTWLTSDILIETLKGFSDSNTELGKLGAEAATKVKTITQLWDTVQESVQSGWTTTWNYIIGDFEEAKRVLSAVSDGLSDLLSPMADSRNALLDFWATNKQTTKTAQETVKEVSNLDEIAQKVIRGDYGNGAERVDLLAQAGWDPVAVQDKVNEILGIVEKGKSDLDAAINDSTSSMTGREMVLKGLSDIAQSFITLLNTASDVWHQIFPPTTGQQLVDASRDFMNTMGSLRDFVDTNVGDIRSIFSGLFSILKMVSTTFDMLGLVVEGFQKRFKIGPIVDEFVSLFSIDTQNGNLVVNILSAIGDGLTKLSNAYANSKDIQDFFLNFGLTLGSFARNVVVVSRSLVSLVSQYVDIDTFASILDGLYGVLRIVAAAFGWVKIAVDGFLSTFQLEGVAKNIAEVLNLTGNVGDLISAIADIVSGNKEIPTFLLNIGRFVGAIVSNILNLTAALVGFITSPTEDTIENLSTAFESLKNILKSAFDFIIDNASTVFDAIIHPLQTLTDFLIQNGGPVISDFFSGLKDKFGVIGQVGSTIAGGVSQVKDNLAPLGGLLKTYYEGVETDAKSIIPNISTSFTKLSNAVSTTKLSQNVDAALTNVKKKVEAKNKELKTDLETTNKTIKNAFAPAQDLIDNEKQAKAFGKNLDESVDAITGAEEEAEEELEGTLEPVQELAANPFQLKKLSTVKKNDVTDAVAKAKDNVVSTIKDVPNDIKATVDEANKQTEEVVSNPEKRETIFKKYGDSLKSGLTAMGNGIQSGISALTTKVKQWKGEVSGEEQTIGPQDFRVVQDIGQIDQQTEQNSSTLSNIGDKIKDTLHNLIEKLKTAITNAKTTLENIDIQEVCDKISGVVKTVFSAVNTILVSLNLSELAGVFSNLRKTFKNISNTTKNISKAFKNLSSPFEQLTDTLSSMQNRINASIVLEIAIAVAVIAAAVAGMSVIDPEKMQVATNALILVFGGLVVTFSQVSSIKKELAALDIGKMIAALSGAVVAMAGVMIELGKLDEKAIGNDIVLLTMIGLFFKTMISSFGKIASDKVKGTADVWSAMAGNILAIGIAMNLLVSPITALSGIPFDLLIQGVGTVLTVLGFLSLIIIGINESMSKNGDKIGKAASEAGKGIMAMAVALNLLLLPIIALSLFPVGILGGAGIIVLISLLTMELRSLIKASKDINPKDLKNLAITIIAFSSAISIMAPAILVLTVASIAWKQAILALGIFAVMMWTFAGVISKLAKALDETKISSKVLISLSAVILTLTGAMTTLLIAMMPLIKEDIWSVIGVFSSMTLFLIGFVEAISLLAKAPDISIPNLAALIFVVAGLVSITYLAQGANVEMANKMLKYMLGIVAIAAVVAIAIKGFNLASQMMGKKSKKGSVIGGIFTKLLPSDKETKKSSKAAKTTEKTAGAVVAVAASIAAALWGVFAIFELAKNTTQKDAEEFSGVLGAFLQAILDNIGPLTMVVTALIGAVFGAIKTYNWQKECADLYGLIVTVVHVLMILMASGDLINDIVTFVFQLIINIAYILSGFIEAICEVLVVLVIGIINGLTNAINGHMEEIAVAIRDMLFMIIDLLATLFVTIFGEEMAGAAAIAMLGFILALAGGLNMWQAVIVAVCGFAAYMFAQFMIEQFGDEFKAAALVIIGMFVLAMALGGAMWKAGIAAVVGALVYFFMSAFIEKFGAEAIIIGITAAALLIVSLVAGLTMWKVILGVAILGVIMFLFAEFSKKLDGLGSRLVVAVVILATAIAVAWTAGLQLGMLIGWAILILAISALVAYLIAKFCEWLGIASPSKVFKDFGINIVQGLINGIKNMFTNIGKTLKELADKFINWVKDNTLIDEAIENGKYLIQGLIDGIKKKAAGIWDAMKEAVGGAFDKFCKFFGIESPSKLMAKMGRYIDMGLALGIVDEQDTVSDAMDELQNSALLDPTVAEGVGNAYTEALAQGLIDESDTVKDVIDLGQAVAFDPSSLDTDTLGIDDHISSMFGDTEKNMESYNIDLGSIFSYDKDTVDTDQAPDISNLADSYKEQVDELYAMDDNLDGENMLSDYMDKLQNQDYSTGDFDPWAGQEFDMSSMQDSVMGQIDKLKEDVAGENKKSGGLGDMLSGIFGGGEGGVDFSSMGLEGGEDFASSFAEGMGGEGSGSMADLVTMAQNMGGDYSSGFKTGAAEDLSEGSGLMEKFSSMLGEDTGNSFLGGLGGVLDGSSDSGGLLDTIKEKFGGLVGDGEMEVDTEVTPVLTAKSKGSLQDEIDQSVEAGTVDVSSDTKVGIEESGMASTIDAMHQNDITFYQKMEQFKTDMGTLVGQNNNLTNKTKNSIEGMLTAVKEIRDDVDLMHSALNVVKSDVSNIMNNMGHDIYIEPGTLVGAIGNEMDAYLGTKSVRQSRTNSGRTYGPVKPTFAR